MKRIGFGFLLLGPALVVVSIVVAGTAGRTWVTSILVLFGVLSSLAGFTIRRRSDPIYSRHYEPGDGDSGRTR